MKLQVKIGLLVFGLVFFPAINANLNFISDLSSISATGYTDQEISLHASSVEFATKRIKRHINFLSYLHEKQQKQRGVWHFLSSHKVPFTKRLANKKNVIDPLIIDISISLKHSVVQFCANNINEKQTLTPIFDAWKKFEAHNIEDEENFIKEFSVLITIIYTEIWQNLSVPKEKSFSIKEIIEIYNKVSELPIIRLLDVLDEFLNQLEPLIVEYQSDGKPLTGWQAGKCIAVDLVDEGLKVTREKVAELQIKRPGQLPQLETLAVNFEEQGFPFARESVDKIISCSEK